MINNIKSNIKNLINIFIRYKCLLLHNKYHIYKKSNKFYCLDKNWRRSNNISNKM